MQAAAGQNINNARPNFAHHAKQNGEDIWVDFASPRIAERLRGTEFDSNGQVFLLNIEYLKTALGDKWESKRQYVVEYMLAAFEKNFQKPNWCAQINEFSFLFVLPTLLPRTGAKQSAAILEALMKYFIGEYDESKVPIYGVMVDSLSKLTIRIIKPEFFEKPPQAANGNDSGKGEKDENVNYNPSLTKKVAGLLLRAGIENFYQLKNMAIIGHRIHYSLCDDATKAELGAKSIEALGISDRIAVDKLLLEMAQEIYMALPAEERKILFVLPVAYLTLCDIATRNKIISEMQSFTAAHGLKAIIEMQNIGKAPHYKVVELISYVKSQNIAVVCDELNDAQFMQELIRARVDGFAIKYVRANRSDAELAAYIKQLNNRIKSCHGFFFIHDLNRNSEIEIARAAGFAHVATARRA